MIRVVLPAHLRTLAHVDGDEMKRRLDDARIANARRRELGEVLEHPQLSARGRWTSVPSPAGDLRALLPPITLPDREPRMDAIPAVGEHTAALLSEIGYEPVAIDQLREAGVC